ncbi:MAG: hypothetical protein ACO3DQ_01755 [Cephaloticoccus sp.]
MHRHSDGYAMLTEMAELGFTHVELSHGIRITLVPGIMKAVEEGVIQVATTHNFCPLPPGVNSAAPNLFEPLATDRKEHDQWLRYTKRSLDFAAQLKARLMVCHLGSVEFFWFNPADKIARYQEKHADADLREDKAYQALLAKSLAKLRQRMGPFWAQTQASVQEVSAYAVAKNVRLGFENREKFTELPLDDDYEAFIAGLPEGSPGGSGTTRVMPTSRRRWACSITGNTWSAWRRTCSASISTTSMLPARTTSRSAAATSISK